MATQGGAKAKGAKTPHWDDVETLVQLTQSPHTGRSQPPACVKENAHFPFLLSWIELGPLGKDDSHFAINPPAPCLPQAATTAAAADTTPGAETANGPPKPSSRSQQRQQEAKRANDSVEEAFKKAAKTDAACVADRPLVNRPSGGVHWATTWTTAWVSPQDFQRQTRIA